MSKKAITKRPSLRARASTKRRASRSAAPCPGQRATPSTVAVLGNSLFAIRFREKPGPEVFFSTMGYRLDDVDVFYKGVLKSLARLHFLKEGKPLTFDPIRKGLSYPVSITWMLRRIKEMIPAGCDFNIDRDKSGYRIVVYRYCNFRPEWCVLEVGPAIIKLQKENSALLHLFLSFLRAFGERCTVELWDRGLMGNSLEMLDDNVLQMEGDSSPEEIADIKKTIQEYRSGLPAKWAKMIRKARKVSPRALQVHAQRFKAGNPIANLIFQGAELLKPEFRLYDYLYYACGEEDYGCYLHLLDQAAIIWKAGDHLIHEHESYLDAEAQEGIMQPVAYVCIDDKTTSADLTKLRSKSSWPLQLQDYFRRAGELLAKYTRQ